jgi:hypothetical protein
MTEPTDKKAPIKVLNGNVQNHVTQGQPPHKVGAYLGAATAPQNMLPASSSNNGTHRL